MKIFNTQSEIFDSDESGSIDFREFVTGLSVLLKGSFDEKIDCTYSMFIDFKTNW